jgi:hypothetical protein
MTDARHETDCVWEQAVKETRGVSKRFLETDCALALGRFSFVQVVFL